MWIGVHCRPLSMNKWVTKMDSILSLFSIFLCQIQESEFRTHDEHHLLVTSQQCLVMNFLPDPRIFRHVKKVGQYHSVIWKWFCLMNFIFYCSNQLKFLFWVENWKKLSGEFVLQTNKQIWKWGTYNIIIIIVIIIVIINIHLNVLVSVTGWIANDAYPKHADLRASNVCNAQVL